MRKGNQLNLRLRIRGNIISQHVTPNMTELLRRVKIISEGYDKRSHPETIRDKEIKAKIYGGLQNSKATRTRYICGGKY